MRFASRVVILPSILTIVLAGNSFSQELSGKILTREIRSDHDLVITYSLNGPAEAEYDVDLFLVWGGSNRRKLEKVSGDIGRGIRARGAKTIHWDVKAEIPDPIEGMSYLFEIEVNRSGGWAWYTYAGIAGVAGGVAWLVLKPNSGVDKKGLTLSIPLPPSR